MLCDEEIEDNAKKKTTLYKERNEEKRSVFLERISPYSKEDIVYVDESGIDSYIHRSHGWALRGQKVHGEVSGKHYARENFIAGKCGSRIIAAACFTGTCDTALFNLWIEEFLVPALRPGQVVILDNAASAFRYCVS